MNGRPALHFPLWRAKNIRKIHSEIFLSFEWRKLFSKQICWNINDELSENPSMQRAFLSPDKLAWAGRLLFRLMSSFASSFLTKTAFSAGRGWIRLEKFYNIQPFRGWREGIKLAEHNGKEVMNSFWCCSCVQMYENNKSVALGAIHKW